MSHHKRPESVLVVVYTRGGEVLLLKRADMPDFWQSVTGAMRWDETDPRVTAARELEEETGLCTAPAALRDLHLTQRFPILPAFRSRYAPEVGENVEHAFALELKDAALMIRLSEHTEYGWFQFGEAERRVASWTDRDAIRMVASPRTPPPPERGRARGGGAALQTTRVATSDLSPPSSFLPPFRGKEASRARKARFRSLRGRVTGEGGSASTTRPEVVVLVHGWLMNSAWMTTLAWRLRRAGFEVRMFSYATMRLHLRENAARLDAFLKTIDAEKIHLVGHSLGGLVIRALLHHFPRQRDGRVVTLGSPHHGSVAAQRLARGRLGRVLLGNSVLDVVSGLPRAWAMPSHDLGTISGNTSFGIGRWISPLPQPNDGTITVDESTFTGARAQLVLPVTHTGLLTSRRVAEAIARFLQRGDFG